MGVRKQTKAKLDHQDLQVLELLDTEFKMTTVKCLQE